MPSSQHTFQVGDLIQCTQEGEDHDLSRGSSDHPGVQLYRTGDLGTITRVQGDGSSPWDRLLVDWHGDSPRRNESGGVREWFIAHIHVMPGVNIKPMDENSVAALMSLIEELTHA
jgi:hypothetical protein